MLKEVILYREIIEIVLAIHREQNKWDIFPINLYCLVIEIKIYLILYYYIDIREIKN